jgi:hypothetical protein
VTGGSRPLIDYPKTYQFGEKKMSSEELMYANWQHMIKPEKIQVSSNPSYGKLAMGSQLEIH